MNIIKGCQGDPLYSDVVELLQLVTDKANAIVLDIFKCFCYFSGPIGLNSHQSYQVTPT